MRDCCTPKMLKETEETIRFVSSFLSLVTFQLRGAGPPWLHLRFYDYQTSLLSHQIMKYKIWHNQTAKEHLS